MATADVRSQPGRSRWSLVGPVAVVVVALVAGLWSSRSPSPGEPPAAEATAPPETVVIEARSGVVAPTLAALVGSSDLVVRATVVSTARGRLVGGDDAGDPTAAVVSRVVSLRVDEVFAAGAAADSGSPDGRAPAVGSTIVVEEEGWLADGRAIAVNGAAPTATGDQAVWFLQAVHDPELTGFVGTGTQGRFGLSSDGAVVPPDRRDPLSVSIAAQRADAFLAALRASP